MVLGEIFKKEATHLSCCSDDPSRDSDRDCFGVGWVRARAPGVTGRAVTVIVYGPD